MRRVMGKSNINRNSFLIIVGRPDELSRSLDILDRNPDRPKTYPYGSGTFVNGPKRSWKCSRRFQNFPKPSRKVLEAFGRFPKFPGSTTYCAHPLTWGASHLGWS